MGLECDFCTANLASWACWGIIRVWSRNVISISERLKHNSPRIVLCQMVLVVGRTPGGSCNNTLLRRVLRRFLKGSAFLEGFLVLRRHLVRISLGTRVLRMGGGVLKKALRRR